MRVLDLFSGIGGFSLGLERAGMRTVAFCEIDPFCRRVLAKHWPEVPIYDDIRDLTAERLAADGIAVDVVCGGFPCQDISVAGKGAGIGGARSGLWSEYARLVGELRPGYVIVENVAALLGRGLDRVLGDLAALGYDAEWHCIPASAVGAPHRRDRLWVVSYPRHRPEPKRPWSTRREGWQREAERGFFGRHGATRPVAYPDNQRQQQPAGRFSEGRMGARVGRETVADADEPRRAQPLRASETLLGAGAGELTGQDGRGWGQWLSEPDVGRVAHGVPGRVDRLRGLGNAVVPQIPEAIGRAILRAVA